MAASLYPFPRFVEADAAGPDPMTNPARQRLAEAIAALDRARGEVDLAAEPVRRLSEVIAEHDRLQVQLHELTERDQKATGAWIAGGRVGADPGDAAADTRSLNDRIAFMRRLRRSISPTGSGSDFQIHSRRHVCQSRPGHAAGGGS